MSLRICGTEREAVCRIKWDQPVNVTKNCCHICASAAGAQRTLEFVTCRWVHVKGGLPISTEGPVQLSPYNPLPLEAQGTGGVFTGLKLLGKHKETPDIMTFVFDAPVRADGKSFCEAGQFASFDFPGLKAGETLNRTWTISSHPQQIAATGKFTISVKKVSSAGVTSLTFAKLLICDIQKKVASPLRQQVLYTSLLRIIIGRKGETELYYFFFSVPVLLFFSLACMHACICFPQCS